MMRSLLLFCALLCALAIACADVSRDEMVDQLLLIDPSLSTAGTLEDNAEPGPVEAPFASIAERCFERSSAAASEVHTIGHYLALGDTMLGVHVEIPSAPRLATCIEEAVALEPPPGPPAQAHEFVSGTFAIDLGGPPPSAGAEDLVRQFEEHERGMKALMQKVVARGVLPADHHLVRDMLESR